jgi:hypothetical protein
MPVELIEEETYKYISNRDKYGREYHTPIVIKNRDQLIGFIDCCYVLMNTLGEETYAPAMSTLSSDRFNDLNENGKHLSKMSKSELKDYIIEVQNRTPIELHKDNVVDWSDYFFMASCHCGSFYGWKTKHEVPVHNFRCPNCGKTVIEYIGVEDEDIIYEGIEDSDMSKVVEEINEENEKNSDIDSLLD